MAFPHTLQNPETNVTTLYLHKINVSIGMHFNANRVSVHHNPLEIKYQSTLVLSDFHLEYKKTWLVASPSCRAEAKRDTDSSD